MGNDNKKALLIFIKNAEKGKVKTRLAKTVGDEKALQIYQELLRYTREVSLKVEADRFLFYSNFIPDSDHWEIADFKKLVQDGEGLGQRMSNAFQYVFQSHNRALIIGSDCATLTPDIIQKAYDSLENHSFVLGPAKDGGYYLLGMRDFDAAVFENMEYSVASVLDETIKRIKDLGKSYFLLPELSDIDTEEDWNKYGWKV